MMKSLEHELRIRFCDKYIEYLKREYPTLEDFTTANNIYKKPGGVRKDGSLTPKILSGVGTPYFFMQI